jgi:hypothetical protein
LEHGESASKLLNRGEERFDGMRMADVMGCLYRRARRTRMASRDGKQSNKLGINFFWTKSVEGSRLQKAAANGGRHRAAALAMRAGALPPCRIMDFFFATFLLYFYYSEIYVGP